MKFSKKLWWYSETCPTLKSGRTGLQCPGGRFDSSKGISLFETLADSFHGLTKNSFDKNKFPVEAKTPTPSRYKTSSKRVNTVNDSKPRLRNELFYNPSIWAFWLGLLNARLKKGRGHRGSKSIGHGVDCGQIVRACKKPSPLVFENVKKCENLESTIGWR